MVSLYDSMTFNEMFQRLSAISDVYWSDFIILIPFVFLPVEKFRRLILTATRKRAPLEN